MFLCTLYIHLYRISVFMCTKNKCLYVYSEHMLCIQGIYRVCVYGYKEVVFFYVYKKICFFYVYKKYMFYVYIKINVFMLRKISVFMHTKKSVFLYLHKEFVFLCIQNMTVFFVYQKKISVFFSVYKEWVLFM